MYDKNEIDIDDEEDWENIEDRYETIDDNTINEKSIIFSPVIFAEGSKYLKCVCKIKKECNHEINLGSGFFCYIPSKEIRVQITNNHIIDNNYLKNEKEIKYYIETKGKQEEKKINLKAERYKFTDKTLDATVIEILDEDFIDNFLEIDEEFIKNKDFKNEAVFNIQFPFGDQIKSSVGKIIKGNLKKNIIIYNAGTEAGSSGSPLLSLKESKVIGMHKGSLKKLIKGEKTNRGIYLENILKELHEYKPGNQNTIKCIYAIGEKDVNQDIQIYCNKKNISKQIKSFHVYKENEDGLNLKDGIYRFPKEGNYSIVYDFKDSAEDFSEMFFNCSFLTKAYIRSFPHNKIKKMEHMFDGCSSLKEIKLIRSFNTEYIKDMSYMFSNCSSLKEINLSSFNTENVEKLIGMLKDAKN